MRIAFVLISLVVALGVQSQNIQWATEVVDFSSQYSKPEYSAERALGEPNAMGPGAKLSNEWRPEDGDKSPFIMVSFSDPMRINQFVIAQSQGAGQIKSVVLYDSAYLEYDAYMAENSSEESTSAYFQQFIPETDYVVYAVRITFFQNDDRPVGIDAIGLANTNLPVTNFLKEEVNEVFENYHVTKLNEVVNTPNNEHNPILSLDGNRLFFSRQNDPGNVGGVADNEDIWFSLWNDAIQDWNAPINVGEPLNNSGPNFLSSIGKLDGKEVMVLGNRYGRNGTMLPGVSISYLENDLFTPPENLEIENEQNYSDNVDFFLVENPTALLISAERDDSYGDRDLYISFRNDDKTWSAPLNLGETINSFGVEESPFLAHDGATLYFSSDGFKGYGGVDIFRTTRLDDTWTKWSDPVNLGPRINSEGDDEYLTLSPDEEHLYFTRSGKDGNSDIYDVNLDPPVVTLTGTVIDSTSGQKLTGADVFISNSQGDFEFTRTNDQGVFKKPLSTNTDWTVTVAKNDYKLIAPVPVKIESEDIAMADPVLMRPVDPYVESRNKLALDPTVSTAVEIRDDRETAVASPTLTSQLDAMDEGESLQLHNVYFDLNSSYLRAESFPELMELASFLIEHIDLEVELSAHTDSRQSKKYNQWISERRAKRVADYLISFGIKPDRITSKGYGEEKLVNNCSDGVECTEDEHQKNRRTEIKLLKADLPQ